MTNLNLTILSYHKFVDEPSDYRFSRTYDQFYHDIRKKVFDLITIDDGMSCQIKACDMLRGLNIRAKLFICTSLVGTEGYCTWAELKELNRWHDIEAHSHIHDYHNKMKYTQQFDSVSSSVALIEEHIGKRPRFFVPPYNQFNFDTTRICGELKMQLVTGRENILNITK